MAAPAALLAVKAAVAVAVDKRGRNVIASVVDLSRKIGAITVAEGIETTEQLELLRAVHCDSVQGYIYSRPLPIPEFEAWLDGREAQNQ